MEEWRNILERGFDKDGEDSTAPLSATTAEAAWAEEPGDEELQEEQDAMEVSTADDAGSLLKAVKERLAADRQSAKYHDFLTAISSSVVNGEAALAIIAGHEDLIASFERCFGATTLSQERATVPMDDDDDLGAVAADRRGPGARASQLVNLVFANKAGRLADRAMMLEYVKTRSKQSAFPRRLFVLRGTAGAGGAAWAMDSLRKEVDITGSSSVAQLAHVCSTDDFGAKKLRAHSIANEARVRLAMEVGLEPLYIANPCMTLWEMRPYVMLADRMGYVVTVVSPEEICPAWNDIDFLLSRSQEKLSREMLETAIATFESLPTTGDARPTIRAASRPEREANADVAPANSSQVLSPSAMLYKLEKLMLEGSNLMRYTPPGGKGWGVNGELEGDWHSFRALADDTCTYEDNTCWRTEDPDKVWTFEGLTWLEDLRVQAFQIEEANLPTAVSHPGLFLSDSQEVSPPAPRTPPAETPHPPPHSPPRSAPLMAAAVDTAPPEAPGVPVPVSRKERLKQRVLQEVEMLSHRDRFKQRVMQQVEKVKEEMDEQGPAKRQRGFPNDLPSPWSRVKQEAGSTVPHAPSEPPPGRTHVKQELGANGARSVAVKTEFGSRVKSEVKTEEVMPRPPTHDPNAPRLVTVGDDTDEEVMDEASITAAVKKGRDECIAQLAKMIFVKERASREGVRQRFDMVRYATRRAAKPRFPRELFILRGPPGIGKTEYAIQQLNDHVDVEPSEALAARLTHICATDDFFEIFKGDGPEYKFESSKLEARQLQNQARVRLAMETGIHPLYIDAPNMRLWEMRPYLALAEQLGYVTTIMEPIEISEKWDDIDFMAPANDTLERSEMGKVVSRGMLAAFIEVFEPLAVQGDPLNGVRSARQGGAPVVVEADAAPRQRNGSHGPSKVGAGGRGKQRKANR